MILYVVIELQNFTVANFPSILARQNKGSSVSNKAKNDFCGFALIVSVTMWVWESTGRDHGRLLKYRGTLVAKNQLFSPLERTSTMASKIDVE
ncbi:hypothetical protein M514_00538 [Trichuris suis]|uniref:Uncharacterized protein n=1 Tax=Trichuris suis TaxID=68888 RepID=A0A085NDD1_9BILA|nr:hypothetical protein M513_00538 [Trichuris suis]KFD67477.1 hypothetical protein M514_00538 [Trichuris suis]